jgi:hypothetical protein
MSKIDPRLYNPLGQAFGMMPEDVQAEMKRLGTAENVDFYGDNGWESCGAASWYHNLVYRIRPGWTPPEPEKPALIECLPYVEDGLWVFMTPFDRVCALGGAPGIVGFRGYRYGAKLNARLRMISLPNGGFKTEIPDAVVFDRAEVEAAK